MKTTLECVPCFLRQSLEAARFVSDDEQLHERLVRHVLRLVAELDLRETPPVVAQAIHRELRQLSGVEDPYRQKKQLFNRLGMELLPELAEIVRASSDPLFTAARLAIAANVIDLGVDATLTREDVKAAFESALSNPSSGDVPGFRRAVADATTILYLADNAGEIAIDRLLIEQLGPKRVTVAVRGHAVINDATLADAHEVGMQDLTEVIENGSDAPGTVLADCSPAFRERFESADLIIAKGQGNFETLSEAAGNIVFLFKVKCPVIASHVGLEIGTFALLRSRDLAAV